MKREKYIDISQTMTYYKINFIKHEERRANVKLVGLEIKKYLDENGIKYSFLSEKIGMPMNMLSPLLNGKRKMSAEEYFTICSALNVPVSKFKPDEMNGTK